MPEVSDQDAAVVRMIQEMDTDPEVRLGLRKSAQIGMRHSMH